MVKLFSTILRRDPEGHVLVTPVEKVSVEVEDAPFLAVEMQVEGDGEARELRLRTNVDDWVSVDAAHPLRFEPGPSGGLKPYVRVRDDLWALVARPVFYDLAALGEVRRLCDEAQASLASLSAGLGIAELTAIVDWLRKQAGALS
jgi:hypothetical protein